jgi:uncharacterized membrane protein
VQEVGDEVTKQYGIDKFLALALAIQLAVWGLTFLSALGLELPLFTPIVGFIYLTFVPGILILRALRLQKLTITETVVYSVGLSLSLCMLIGFLLNLTGPFIGISKPIASLPLLTTMTVSVLILCGLSYRRDRTASSPVIIDTKKVNVREFASPALFFLLLIPLVSILGAYLVNFYHNNILLLLLICVICIAVALISFNKFIPARLYPLTIFSIAVALLYHKTLISSYLTGWDIHLEYYFSQLTLMNSYWDLAMPYAYNSTLSATILPATYSSLLHIDAAWIYKIAYPLFFSLVPVALYETYRRQTNERTAFLAAFFFMSLEVFFCAMASLLKQQIAELFLALLVLLILSRGMNSFKRAILTMVFSASLVVSHYALSYIVAFYILLAWLLLYLVSVVGKIRRVGMLTGAFASLFLVMVVGWYMYMAGSVSFAHLVGIGNHIYTNISDFFFTGSRELTVVKLLGLAQPVHIIGANFYRITQLFIIIGVIRLMTKHQEMKFELEYAILAFLSMLLLSMCIILPYFSEFLHIERFYHITLFFLSPFCILGGETFFRWLHKLIKAAWIKIASMISWLRRPISSASSSVSPIYTRLVVLLVLIPYFLFTSGFIYELTGDKFPTSISLSKTNYRRSNIEEVIAQFHSGYTFESDVFSARWLSNFKGKGSNVYSDVLSLWYILPSYGLLYPSKSIYPDTELTDNGYIYLSRLNVANSLMTVPVERDSTNDEHTFNYATSEISRLLQNKIYSNGGSEVYLVR